MREAKKKKQWADAKGVGSPRSADFTAVVPIVYKERKANFQMLQPESNSVW